MLVVLINISSRYRHGFTSSASLAKPAELITTAYKDQDNIDMCGRMCEYPHMATNLSIDPELLEKALQVSGEKTKKAAVTQALVEFIAKRERTRVKELFGQLDWDSDYDYKKERSR